MRLWHYRSLGFLPKNQLVSQLRECVCIAKNIYEKNTPNNILVNKIMDYDLQEFRDYCNMVLYEMICNRGYEISAQTVNKLETYIDFNVDSEVIKNNIFNKWHTDKYLLQNYYNLEEKYDCGSVTEEEWIKYKNGCIKLLNDSAHK